MKVKSGILLNINRIRLLPFIALGVLCVISSIPVGGSAEKIALSPAAGHLLKMDFEGPVFEDPGNTVKDHSLIRKNGLFHLYYIRGDEDNLGYATSTDLRHWTLHQPVVLAGPEDWDGRMVWAPHVIPNDDEDGYLLMYYTGVNRYMAQRTCLAYSKGDPAQWIKPPVELFEPFHGDTSWTIWSQDQWSNYRDPYFFSDDGTNYIIQSAKTKDNVGAIALSSSGGYYDWEDAGPLFIHDNWHMLESCSILKRGGGYHLFFTEEQVGGISYMYSDSLKSGWDIVTRMIIDGGHACELLEAGPDEYIFSRHSSYSLPGGEMLYTIRFDTLYWDSGSPDIRKTDILSPMWTETWGTAFDYQPVYGNTFSYRGIDTVNIGFEGNWWIGTYERFDGPIYGPGPGSIQGDEARGEIRSNDFVIKGRSMRMLVGGGFYPDSCYIALCDSETDTIIRSETGKDTESMDERTWNLDPWVGKSVYLKIVDNATGPFGHINVDGIEESYTPAVDIPDSARADGPAPKDIDPVKGGLLDSGGVGEPQPFTGYIDNYPNPFNPFTEIRVSWTPLSRLKIVIFSVAGRRIIEIPVTLDSSGEGNTIWQGRDRAGNRVSSGVYNAVLYEGRNRVSSRKLVLLR